MKETREIIRKIEEFRWKVTTEVMGEFEHSSLKLPISGGRFVTFDVWYRSVEELCDELMIQLYAIEDSEWLYEQVASGKSDKLLVLMDNDLEDAAWIAKKCEELLNMLMEVKEDV